MFSAPSSKLEVDINLLLSWRRIVDVLYLITQALTVLRVLYLMDTVLLRVV